MPQIFPRHGDKFAFLVQINRRFRRLYVVCRAGFDLDKTQHILIPANQINFAPPPRRTEEMRAVSPPPIGAIVACSCALSDPNHITFR